MLKYYKRMKDSKEEHEITYDEALQTLLGSWLDTDMTGDMLTIQNYIICSYSCIRVVDPDDPLVPIPGLFNLTPDDAEYDEKTMARIN